MSKTKNIQKYKMTYILDYHVYLEGIFYNNVKKYLDN